MSQCESVGVCVSVCQSVYHVSVCVPCVCVSRVSASSLRAVTCQCAAVWARRCARACHSVSSASVHVSVTVCTCARVKFVSQCV